MNINPAGILAIVKILVREKIVDYDEIFEIEDEIKLLLNRIRIAKSLDEQEVAAENLEACLRGNDTTKEETDEGIGRTATN